MHGARVQVTGAPTVAAIICGALLPWPGARMVAQWLTAALFVSSVAVFTIAALRTPPSAPVAPAAAGKDAA